MKIGIIVTTILFITGAVVLYFYSINISKFFGIFCVELIFYLVIISNFLQMGYGKWSFNHPSSISANDVGRMMKVVEIRNQNNIIGLVKWGYTAYGIGELQDASTYYILLDIPKELWEINCVFRVESGGFKKVQVNGYGNSSKEPFEVLSQVYFVDKSKI